MTSATIAIAKYIQCGIVLAAECIDVKLLDFFSGPVCSTQKFQRGFNRGIVLETVQVDTLSKAIPAEMIDQFGNNRFKRNAM